jgi:uncharacterized protein (DUF952 family)
MSVIFHIATQQHWERASRAGVYTTASLREDGFIHGATATQHATVANKLFAGRADLVLLLIDTDTLSSEIRFERSDTDNEAFPHVYGPVDLDAIFEATPYRPGPDGRFHPHEEASGFAAHGAATLQETARRVLRVMAGFPGAWWVAGGWALDLFLGHKTRPHADVELSVLAADQWALFGHLRGWDLRLAAPGSSLPAWDGSWIQPPFHQVWARRGPVPGCPAGPDEFAADPDHARVSAGAEHHRSLGVPAPPGRHPAAGPGRDHHRRGRGGGASGDRAVVQGQGTAVQGPAGLRPRAPLPGWDRTSVAEGGAGAGASRARLAWSAVNHRHGIGGRVEPLATEVICDYDFHLPPCRGPSLHPVDARFTRLGRGG